MEQQEIDRLFANISQADPKQLRKVIDILINKSRLLIHNLEQTWEKLEQVQSEKIFWKESYFNLRKSCEQYIDSNGLTPFNYITSLEDQLKKQKIDRSCLQQKFKIMHPHSINIANRNQIDKKNKTNSLELQMEQQISRSKNDINQSNFSTVIKDSPAVEGKIQNKHKIGPKNIQFFKFKQQKVQS